MKTMTTRLMILGLCSLLLSFAGRVVALPSSMLHPNVMRGIGDVSHEFTVDKVDMFNGNLGVEIPLGQAYPVTPNFSYRLVLTHNSNAWDLTSTAAGEVSAQPMAHSNAGFGWDLSLGRLVDPGAPGNTVGRWIYVDPTGRPHPFHQRLHVDIADEAPDVYYSRDGDYLRLRQVSSDKVLVEEPDGLVRSFAFDAGQNDWRLSKIEDPFGNHVSIAYQADRWTLTDSHGRIHRVVFQADPAGHYASVIDRVEMEAFGGTIATYELSYGTGQANRGHAAGDTDPSTPTYVDVPLLESVTLPDASSYLFEYGSVGQRLNIMTLPTLGRIEWTYRTYTFELATCTSGSLPGLLRTNVGLGARTTYLASGEVEGRWLITSWNSGTEPSPGCKPYLATRVVTPRGSDFRYFFMIDTVSEQRDLYGLPFRTNAAAGAGRFASKEILECAPDGTSCSPLRRYFHEFHQDSAGGAQSDPADPLSVYRNRREVSTRVVYVDDPHPNGGYNFAEVRRSDFDGLGHFRVTESGGTFGKADYLKRETAFRSASGTYPATGWAKPLPAEPWILDTFAFTSVGDATTTERVDYCFDHTSGLKTRQRLRASSAAPVAHDVVTSYVYDGEGNLVEERFFGGEVQPLGVQSDLCAVPLDTLVPQYRIRHTHQYGVRSQSKYLNADGSIFGPPFLDQTIDPSTGLVSTERDSAGIATGTLYDAMGRITMVKPASGHGAWTSHIYTNASGNAWWQKAKVETRKYPNGQSGGSGYLTRSATYYDDFGRRERTRRWLPGERESHTLLRYDALGSIELKSEAHYAGDPVRWKQYLDRDPFGRVGIVRPPGGAAHDIVYQYLGDRSVRRTRSEAVYHNGGNVVQEARTTEELFDRQGRLWKRIANGSPISGSPDRLTEYVRDPAGRVTKILVDGEPSGPSLTLDGRGYVTRRDTEHGRTDFTKYDAMGNASRLTARWYTTPGNWGYNYGQFDLENVYDRAARLVAVHSPNRKPHLLQEFVYANANMGTNYRAGKLVRTRYHFDFERARQSLGGFLPTRPITVTEDFTYAGSGGRMSSLKVSMTDNTLLWESANTALEFDELGNLEQIGYPHGAVLGYSARSRTVRRHYESGFLVRVDGDYDPDWGTVGGPEVWGAFEYHANGMVATIQHGNGVSYAAALDPSGSNRYGSFITTGGSGWNLHRTTVSYDSRGSAVKYKENGVDQYLVPDQPPFYQEPVASGDTSGFCGGHWGGAAGLLDPLGRQIAFQGVSDSDWNCNPKAYALYTASGDIYKFQDDRGSAGSTTIRYFRDPAGRVLTEFYDGELRDYIYGSDSSLLGTHIHTVDGDSGLHHHPAVGGDEITDDLRRRQ